AAQYVSYQNLSDPSVFFNKEFLCAEQEFFVEKDRWVAEVLVRDILRCFAFQNDNRLERAAEIRNVPGMRGLRPALADVVADQRLVAVLADRVIGIEEILPVVAGEGIAEVERFAREPRLQQFSAFATGESLHGVRADNPVENIAPQYAMREFIFVVGRFVRLGFELFENSRSDPLTELVEVSQPVKAHRPSAE